MKIRNFIFAASLALTAACASAPIETAPVDVSYTSSSATKGLAGYHPLTVRSYARQEGQQRVETSGASCKVAGSGFNATVVTPGIVNVPVYGPATRSISVTCNDGEQSKTVVAAPYNVTSAKRIESGAAGGLIGIMVMAGADAVSDKSNDAWGYREARIEF